MTSAARGCRAWIGGNYSQPSGTGSLQERTKSQIANKPTHYCEGNRAAYAAGRNKNEYNYEEQYKDFQKTKDSSAV